MRRSVGPQRDRQHHLPAGNAIETDADKTALTACRALGPFPGFFDVPQNSESVIQKYTPDRRQFYAVNGSIEKSDAEIILQVANLPRQGRLGDVQARRRAVE